MTERERQPGANAARGPDDAGPPDDVGERKDTTTARDERMPEGTPTSDGERVPAPTEDAQNVEGVQGGQGGRLNEGIE